MATLFETVRNACRNVPYYRERCIQHGIPVDSDKDLHQVVTDDFTKLPFTTKQDLRDQYPYGAFAQNLPIARIHVSSGSTGKPTVVGHTSKDLAVWKNIMHRSLRLLGVSSEDILYNAFPYGLGTGGLGVHDAAQAMGCCVIPASTLPIHTQVRQILELEPTVVCATPSYAAAMGETLEGRPTSVKLLICGAEAWSEAMKDRLEALWGVPARNLYGLSELLGPGVAVESADRPGVLQGDDLNFIFEVIDPQTLQPVETGVFGELVVTTRTREAMPLIRYRTGDWTRILSTLSFHHHPDSKDHIVARPTILDRIQGRIVDRCNYGGVDLFPADFEKVLFSFPEIDTTYKIRRQGSHSTIYISVRTPLSDAATEERLTLAVLDALSDMGIAAGSVFPCIQGRWEHHNLHGSKAERLVR